MSTGPTSEIASVAREGEQVQVGSDQPVLLSSQTAATSLRSHSTPCTLTLFVANMSSIEYDKYLIGVPATTANVGPGFDVAGIALNLSLKLTVSIPKQKPAEHSLPVIEYTGLDSENVPLSPYKNLLTRVALYVLRCNDIPTFPSGVHILANNQIPFGRGLGSSGAAVIAGVLLGDLLGNLKLDKSRLLDFALMVERHPDNVTAALIGGFVGSYLKELSPEETNASQIPLAEVLPEYPPDAGENWGQDPPKPPKGIGHYVRFGWAPEIKAVAVMPQFELATAKARGVLPESYSRKDMVRMSLIQRYLTSSQYVSSCHTIRCYTAL